MESHPIEAFLKASCEIILTAFSDAAKCKRCRREPAADEEFNIVASCEVHLSVTLLFLCNDCLKALVNSESKEELATVIPKNILVSIAARLERHFGDLGSSLDTTIQDELDAKYPLQPLEDPDAP